MTPFAQLEKSAFANIIRGASRFGIGDKLLRFGQGLKSVPGNIIRTATGAPLTSSAGRAGLAGEATGLGLLGGGLATGVYNLAKTKENSQQQEPNNGQRLGAIHPDLIARMQEGAAAGRDAASRGLSKEEAIMEFLERYGSAGGNGQRGILPPGMRFDAKPLTSRDFNRMAGTGGMADRDPLQPAQRDLINYTKTLPFVNSAIPDLSSLPSGFQQNKLLQALRGPQ